MFNSPKKIIPEALFAYKSRIPDSLNVIIKKSEDGGYWAEVLNFPGCVTQANNGKELFYMVNDAIYTYFEIPQEYLSFMPTFLPSEEARNEFGIKIPEKFLNRDFALQRI